MKKEKKETKEKERLTIRFDNFSKLKLDEMSQKLNVSYSLLIRTIVLDFINKNEKHINNIIDNTNNANDL